MHAYQRMIAPLEAEEQLAWLPVLKAETKEAVERVVRELRAQARMGETTRRPRRERRERPPKDGERSLGDVQAFLAPLDTAGRVRFVTKEEKARIKAAWIEESKAKAAENQKKAAEQRARMIRKAQRQQKQG